MPDSGLCQYISGFHLPGLQIFPKTRSNSIVADLLILKTRSKSIVAGLLILKTRSKSIVAGLLILKIRSKSIVADLLILKIRFKPIVAGLLISGIGVENSKVSYKPCVKQSPNRTSNRFSPGSSLLCTFDSLLFFPNCITSGEKLDV